MKSIGPFLNRDMGGFDRPRALFSGLPVGADFLCDYKYFFDDFQRFGKQLNGAFTGTATGTAADVAAGAMPAADTYATAGADAALDTLETSVNLALAEVQAILNAANPYQIVKDTGASVAIDADAEDGVLKLSSAATTDNDGAIIQMHQTNFLVKSGKKLWFEARIKLSDADQGDLFVGLANEVATDPENLWAAGAARVGFKIADGDASILCEVDDDTSTTVSQDSGVDAADDTFVKLGIRTDGGSVRFYVNRALVHTASIPSAIAAVTMGVAFGGISGNATGTHTRSIDYVMACQER